MLRATRLAGSAAAVALLVWSIPAWAPFHSVVIEQVFFGTGDCPNAQYVMLRTLAPGQIVLGSRGFSMDNANGGDAGVFGTFNDTLANGDPGVAILMGTPEAEALFGIAMDGLTSGRLIFADGRVCWAETDPPFDCVAYGAFTGDNGAFGDPAPAPQLGMALVRQSNSSNNATDFILSAAAPQNNAGQIGALGTCVGAAATPTPSAIAPLPTSTGIAPTPTATIPAVVACFGDCNNDGAVLVNEVITLVNIILGSAQPSACPSLGSIGPIGISDAVRAVNNLLNGCPATPTPTPTLTPTLTPTTIPDTPTIVASPTATRTPGGPLGVRHFSLNQQTSSFIVVLGPGVSFPSPGFTGFLELTAGTPAGPNGLAFVDVTGASEYLSVNIAVAGLALCIRIPPDQLPVTQAGVVSCAGGVPLGLELSEDHNLGVAGACSGGVKDGLACSSDAQCPEATCFSADACAAAGGRLEGAGGAHPGVCNGPIAGAQLSGDSGPGAVLISPDPINGFTKGLPVEITMERSLPCGDEGAPGMSVAIALTTGRARCRVLDYNNSSEGAELVDERSGENFSCPGWPDENGPGTFVLNAPQLDLPALGPQPTDLISSFVFDD